MAVCTEIHTNHINTVCGQNVEFVNVKLAVHTYSDHWALRSCSGHVVLFHKPLYSSVTLPFHIYADNTPTICVAIQHLFRLKRKST